MARYRLKPYYHDLRNIPLGQNISSIKKALKKHWEDVIEFPGDYEKSWVKKVKAFLSKKS